MGKSQETFSKKKKNVLKEKKINLLKEMSEEQTLKRHLKN
jgi:hypothetical protein